MRKSLFKRGIRDGFLVVEEVEDAIPPGLLTAAEKWLLYFSLRASHVELRDRSGRVMTPDEIVPEHRASRRNGSPPESERYQESSASETMDADHLA